jgi:hypothetical protein
MAKKTKTAAANGTPLTQYGSRVLANPTVTSTPVVTATAVVKPVPTVRTMIVCVPDELPREALSNRQLDTHFKVRGAMAPRFWASKALHLWQRREMFDLRKGDQPYCAGGPIRLLDLVGMRRAAAMGAGIRHQAWYGVVRGTREAKPWPVFLHRHLADPASYTWQTAKEEYGAQPRINAMRMHNAVTFDGGVLDTAELEMFQAGPSAYMNYHAGTAVAADALLTHYGAKLAPASDVMADRATYLEQARQYLGTLTESQRLLAVTL